MSDKKRRSGHSHLVYDKATRTIVIKETGEPAIPEAAMSEHKGPFDDAIRILKEASGEAILVDEELMEVQLESAIAVLEAAGNLTTADKIWLRLQVESLAPTPQSLDRFRALLEAIPDGGKE